MIITSRWSRNRLLVLVGERHLTAIEVKQDWRGRWCASRTASVPLEGELSQASLATSLQCVVDDWKLGSSVGIHWFLPPDILAVSLVGQTAGNAGRQLVLPYAQGQTISMQMYAHANATVWLWIHQAWIDVVRQASTAIRGHVMYLHPRAVFFSCVLDDPNSVIPAHDASALHVVPDGRYAHIFAGAGCVRSFTRTDDATSTGAAPDEREQAELATASALLNLPVATRRDASQPDFKLDMVPVAAIMPVSGATLHRTGILCHSLAIAAEKRIKNLALALSTVVMAGTGALFVYAQQTAQINIETRKLLREFVPQATAARELKTFLIHQDHFLHLAEKLNGSPDLFQTLGHVIEKIPSDMNLTGIEMTSEKISLSAYVQNAKKAKTDIEIGDNAFKVLTAQPAMDEISHTGAVHRTYAKSLTGDRP